jgi:hypothetical protein
MTDLRGEDLSGAVEHAQEWLSGHSSCDLISFPFPKELFLRAGLR